jgi:hypothetical protein
VYVVMIAAAIPADVEAVYHELLERLGPAERAELARLLLDDGALWADYYPVVPAAEVKTSKRHLRVKKRSQAMSRTSVR